MSAGGSVAVEDDKSPRNKVKFMCSFGGKILPRPSDGILKYVGGETRVIAVSPRISFSELMKKLNAIAENEIMLKYQIFPEDLDALVSVKSDEDLKHMMDEYSRHENAGTPKLRTFLFPENPVVLEHQFGPIESQSIEQRYIEAINGIIRTSNNSLRMPTNGLLRVPIKTRPSFTVSACSSPKSESPDAYSHEVLQPPEICLQNNNNNNYQLSRLYPMHKVKSSPNICGHHNLQQLQQLQPQHHQFAYSQRPSYLTSRPPQDFHKAAGWEPSGYTLNQYTTTYNSGSGSSKWGCQEDRRHWGRASSVPQSPRNHGLRS